MIFTILKVGFTACLIVFASWLSGKRPDIAGFIVALPLVTLITLALSHGQYQDAANSIAFAKSILAAIPLTLLFFVPFLLADKINIGFWGLYAMGIAALVAGYFAHRWIVSFL